MSVRMHLKRNFNQDNELEIFSDLSMEFLLSEEINSIVELIDDDIYDQMLSTGLENPNSSEIYNRNSDDIMNDASESILYNFVGDDVMKNVDKKEILNFICNKKFPDDKVDALIKEINEDATKSMIKTDYGSFSMMENQQPLNPYYNFNINQVITELRSVCGLYHLRRNKPVVFSIFYGKPSINDTWILMIELLPESDVGGRSEILRVCNNDKHNIQHWFSCNGTKIPIGSGYQALLIDGRCEKSVSIKFPCNSSCTSMYTKAILQFKIVDSDTGNIIRLQQFKIRVSERPARDARENLEKLHHQSTNIINNNIDYMHYIQFINDPFIINKEIPKLFDYTVPGYNFNIQLLKKDDFNCDGNKFAESDGKLIHLRVNFPQRPFDESHLFLRCMIVDPKFPEKPMVCDKHRIDYILRCNEENVEYVGTKHGVYADERLALKIPLRSEFSLYFSCKNSCFVERNRKYAGLIVILENEHGQMLARRAFKFAIIIRPKRSNLNYDDSDDEDFANDEIKNKKRRIMSLEMQYL